jgi:hypothetical protein
MIKNILVNTIVGAIVVFILSSIWHVATPLGEVGVKNLPQEALLSPAMKLAIPDAGFYFFPGINRSKDLTREQQQTEQQRYLNAYRQGPTGILVYSPGGEDMNFGKNLVGQFLVGAVSAFFIAWILAVTARATTYGQRVLIVALISAFGAITVTLPQWIWYKFPTNYTVAYSLGFFVTWGLTGLVMGSLVGKQVKPMI